MKYTIIYSHGWMSGSHYHAVTKSDRVLTNDLAELLKTDKYAGNVWFVFIGWPAFEGEWEDPNQPDENDPIWKNLI